MRVIWTMDKNLVRDTIVNCNVYPYVSDDTCPEPKDFVMPDCSSEVFWAACYDGDDYVGCFCFFEKNTNEAEIHTCLLPSARGKSCEFGKFVIDLFFKETSYQIMSTFIPVNNVLAKKLALKCGFLYYSDDKPFIINGIEVPTKKYILSRGDICQ